MKKAILIVSFGTTDLSQLEQSIMSCVKAIDQAFDSHDTYYAFSSQVVISRLKERHGYLVPTLTEAMDQIVAAGYGEVTVQPLHLMAGKEYDKVSHLLENYRSQVMIHMGRPFLEEELLEQVALSIRSEHQDDNAFYLWIGHGSDHEAHTIYEKLAQIMASHHMPSTVMTLGEYTRYEEVAVLMNGSQKEKLCVRPLMLVAGNHMISDIQGNHENCWEYHLGKIGKPLSIVPQGLGTREWVQQTFVERTQSAHP